MARNANLDNNELLRMRDAGMTNQDIANAVGVSRITIYNRIGPQPGRNWNGYKARMARGEAKRPEPDTVVALPAEPAEATLVVDNRVIYLTGLNGEYCLDLKNRMVKFIPLDAQAVMEISFDDWTGFAKEVNAIASHLNDTKLTPEMW